MNMKCLYYIELQLTQSCPRSNVSIACMNTTYLSLNVRNKFARRVSSKAICQWKSKFCNLFLNFILIWKTDRYHSTPNTNLTAYRVYLSHMQYHFKVFCHVWLLWGFVYSMPKNNLNRGWKIVEPPQVNADNPECALQVHHQFCDSLCNSHCNHQRSSRCGGRPEI